MSAPRSNVRRPACFLVVFALLGCLTGAASSPAADTGKSNDRSKPAAVANAKPASPAPGKAVGFVEVTDRAKAAERTAGAKHTAAKAPAAAPSKPVAAVKPSAAPNSAPPAAKPNPEPTAVDLSKDPDFAFQGEFVGPVSVTPSQYQRLAVQIRPTGTGGFDAMQYQGGLPGEPSHRPAAVTLVGKRWERFLVLSGGPWAIFVEPDHCVLFDRQGQRVGRLERIVRQSPTLGALPPKDAIVLFDGKNTNLLTTARITADGLLMEGADLRPLFQDFNLHVEFLLPYLPSAKDQGRANSGVYLQSRYEMQVLDSFAQAPAINGCGAIYKSRKPDLNMCLPPMTWQTYDIAFTAPRWLADGTKWKNGRVSVWLNGVKVQNNVELTDKTGAGKLEDPLPLPIRFQDHRNPVRFRNIWLVDRGAAPVVGFPVHFKPADPAPQPPKKPAQAPSAKPKAEKPVPADAAKTPQPQKPAGSQPKPAPQTQKP